MHEFRRLLMLAVVAAGVVAAACADRPPDSAREEIRPGLRIGRFICGGHLALAVLEKHFRSGLAVNTIQITHWNDAADGLRLGRFDGAFMLAPLAMEMIRNGLPAKIVFAADRNGNGFVLDNKYKSILDLKARKVIIAAPHIYSQHHILLHLVLKQNNIPAENVTVLALPPRDMIDSLRRREIDGFIVGEPEANKAVSLGAGWMAAISPDIWKDHIDHVFLAMNHLRGNPGQLQELIERLVRSSQFIKTNPHDAAVMGEDYTGSPAAIFEQVLTGRPDWIDFGDMIPTVKDIEGVAEKLVAMGLWKDMPENPDGFLDSQAVEQALAKMAGTQTGRSKS